MKTRIAIPSDPLFRPLVLAAGRMDTLVVTSGTWSDVTRLLRRDETDIALVSPLEYAQESSHYRIVPGFGISSFSGVELRFREGLRTIETMAADPARLSEIVLAQIVLREEFDSRPAIIPMAGSTVEQMLGKSESALGIPDEAWLTEGRSSPFVDLAEAWREMVGVPYVHGILCARGDSLNPAEVAALARGLAEQSMTEFSSAPALRGLREVVRGCRFDLDEEAREGLQEFLRYAHYHGMTRDIPALRFYGTPDLLDEN